MVAGGGGSSSDFGGGGGAGGYRASGYGPSPLQGSALTLDGGTTSSYVTVGAGGSGTPAGCQSSHTNGNNSVFSSITSAGGGRSGFQVE